MERRLGPADRPTGARLNRRDVAREILAVQRVAHLGAQGVASAEPAREQAVRRAVLEQLVPHGPGEVPGNDDLEADLAGVAGAAHRDVDVVPGHMDERHVLEVGRQAEVAEQRG